MTLGEVPRPLVSELASQIARLVGAAVARTVPQPRPAYAFNKDRGQYHASAVLRRLAQLRAGRPETAVLGLTDVDLFVPELPFVVGDADRDSQSALLSLARLGHGCDGRPAPPDRLRHRALVEGTYQLGLLLGLSPCQDPRCAMHACQRTADIDRKGGGFCITCRAALGLT